MERLPESKPLAFDQLNKVFPIIINWYRDLVGLLDDLI